MANLCYNFIVVSADGKHISKTLIGDETIYFYLYRDKHCFLLFNLSLTFSIHCENLSSFF